MSEDKFNKEALQPDWIACQNTDLWNSLKEETEYEVITKSGYQTKMLFWNKEEGFDGYAEPFHEEVIFCREIKESK